MTPRTRSAQRVELRRRRFLVDGRPSLLLGGEVHYFRLPRAVWRDRLEALLDAGGNLLSTYVPWLWHELPGGDVDLTGRTHEQRDLAGILDLAADLGLAVVVRPGAVHHGRGQERGHSLPRLRPARCPAEHLGRCDGPDAHRRLPRAGVPRGGSRVVRRGDAGRRGSLAAQGRSGRRCAAGQRGGDAVVGHELTRPHRPRLRGSAGLGDRPLGSR